MKEVREQTGYKSVRVEDIVRTDCEAGVWLPCLKNSKEASVADRE